MTSYGFGKKPGNRDTLDLSGISRTPLPIDPLREEAAMARGVALGFIDRGESTAAPDGAGEGPIRRRRQPTPQTSLYIKGPKETLDWFIDYTNKRGHRSYWQALAELRAMVEREKES